MQDAAGLFIALAGIILIGFFAGLLAHRSHFPDLLVLIGVGLFLGPVNSKLLHIESIERVVGAVPFEVVTPVFGALALSVIMFDAGLSLSLADLATGLKRAVVHTTLIFALTVVLVAAACHYVLGFPWLVGAFLGTIVGGISSAVAVTVVRSMRVSAKARAMVTVECLLVDVLTIGTAVALIEAIRSGGVDAGAVSVSVAQALAFGITIGLAVGLAFAFALPRMRGLPNLYILTLGAFVGTYALIEAIGGSGPMGVLAFGLVLGNNGHSLFRGRDLAPELTAEIGRFHDQTTFLVRTFFFVLLGLTFTLELSESTRAVLASKLAILDPLAGSGTLFWLGATLTFLVILLVRAIVSRSTAPTKEDRLPLALIVGRGLGSAVLATLPFSVPELRDATSAYALTMRPYEDVFPTFTGAIIVLTVLTTAAGVIIVGTRGGNLPEPEAVVSRARP